MPSKAPRRPTLVLYNTCSIREKAAQKVFSRLGDWREILARWKRLSASWAVWRSRKAKKFLSARRG